MGVENSGSTTGALTWSLDAGIMTLVSLKHGVSIKTKGASMDEDMFKEWLLLRMKHLDGSIQWRTYVSVVDMLKDMYRAVNIKDIDEDVLHDWACDIADQIVNGIK